jgi:hypothetical protein
MHLANMYVSMCISCRSLGYCWLLIVMCLLSVSDDDCQSNQAPRFFVVDGRYTLVVGCQLLIVGVGKF